MANNYSHLLEPEQLASRLGEDNLLIVDLCSDQQYAEGHVPGAVHVSPGALMDGRPPAPGKLPTEERLSELVTLLGLGPNTHVVVYDDEGGGWAGRMAWTLDVLGHTAWSSSSTLPKCEPMLHPSIGRGAAHAHGKVTILDRDARNGVEQELIQTNYDFKACAVNSIAARHKKDVGSYTMC